MLKRILRCFRKKINTVTMPHIYFTQENMQMFHEIEQRRKAKEKNILYHRLYYSNNCERLKEKAKENYIKRKIK